MRKWIEGLDHRYVAIRPNTDRIYRIICSRYLPTYLGGRRVLPHPQSYQQQQYQEKLRKHPPYMAMNTRLSPRHPFPRAYNLRSSAQVNKPKLPHYFRPNPVGFVGIRMTCDAEGPRAGIARVVVCLPLHVIAPGGLTSQQFF